MSDENRHITAQISDGEGTVTSDVVIDTETGESVSTNAMGPEATELLDLFQAKVAELNAQEGDDDADGD